MSTATYRSRFDTRKRGPITFRSPDLEVCRLLAPGKIREPWSYQYLPTSYFALLLDRGIYGAPSRLPDLSSHDYIRQSEQPKHLNRELIYNIGHEGIIELREDHDVPTPALRKLPHELLACIIGASFEYGAKKHGLEITPLEIDSKIYPDWPVFKLNRHVIFIEADMGTETLEGSSKATTIAEKYEKYLALFDSRVSNGLAVFVTNRKDRTTGLIETLKRTIDRKRFSHRLARNFIFTNVKYDRYINTIPKLTDWAVAGDYQQAGKLASFNFLKKEAAQN